MAIPLRQFLGTGMSIDQTTLYDKLDGLEWNQINLLLSICESV